MNQTKIYEELYSLCEKILAKEPWDFLTDSQLIHLQSNNLKVNVFANVLGNDDDIYGVAFYQDLNDYAFIEMSDQLNIPDYAAMTQSPMVVYFDHRDFLSQDQQEIYSSLEEKFSFPENRIPYLLSFETGFFPNTPLEKELLQFSKYLSLFLISLDYLPDDRNWFYQSEDVDAKIAYFHFDGDKVEGEIVPLEDQGFTQEIPNLEIESLEDLKQRQSQTSISLEMDIRYLPFPHELEEYDRPISMPHIIVANKSTGEIYGEQSRIIQPKEEHAYQLQLSLLYWIEEHGIPKEVHLRSDYFASMLQQIQQVLDFELIVDETLPEVDHFWYSLLDYFAGNDSDVDPQNLS